MINKDLQNQLEKLTKETVSEYLVDLYEYGHKLCGITRKEGYYDNLYLDFEKYSKEEMIYQAVLLNSMCDFYENEFNGKSVIRPEEKIEPKVFDKNHKDMVKGKRGERITAEYLTNHGYVVEDKSNDNYYRSIDTDFLINGTITLETKTNKRTKQDQVLVLEILNDEYTNYPGWFYKCQAQYLNVVSEDRIYFYDLNEMKSYIEEANRQYTAAGQVPDKTFNTFKKKNGVDDAYTVIAFNNYDNKFGKTQKAYCLKVDMHRYASTGRFLKEIKL